MKNAEVMALVNIIKLYDKHLISNDKKARIMDWYGRLEFRLGELLKESTIKEANIKLVVYQEIINILKEKNLYV